MQRVMTTLLFIAWLAASLAPAAAQSVDPAAEEAAIRELDGQWVAVVEAKDAAATAEFYADDGAFLPPGAPIAEGRPAIAAAWGGFYKLANFELTFAPTRITIAQSGDVAFEVGTYSLAFDGDQGRVRDKGKYVVAWKKAGGAWKAAADIFNSNGAAQ